MASGPTLPPQAYTRETLTSAFNWLQTQPDSVRKLATTPDALVGLFVRAQRFGASSLEADAPVSQQNFMSDLKNLAEGLKQFEEPREQRAQAQHQSSMHTHMPQQQNMNFGNPSSSSMTQAHHVQHQPPMRQQTPQAFAPAPQTHAHVPSSSANSTMLSGAINERAMQMIQEVKNHFNLSNDAEAINMMAAIAHKSLKSLFV